MNTAEFEAYVAESRQLAQQHMQDAKDAHGLGTFQRYDIDLPTASIRFLDAHKVERVRADIQVAGSWSAESQSWMWPWDNPSLPPAVHSRMKAVQAFGAKEGLAFLQMPVQPCDEGMAWSLAAVAARLIDAECVYRAPGAKSDLFLLLFKLETRSGS
jgi:hypothetical protein